MPKKMTRAQAKRKLHSLALDKMIAWSRFIRVASQLGHSYPGYPVQELLDAFDSYYSYSSEYDRLFAELTS